MKIGLGFLVLGFLVPGLEFLVVVQSDFDQNPGNGNPEPKPET